MYRTTLCLAALAAAALVSLPGGTPAQPNNPKNQPKAVPATAQDYYLIQNQKSLTGQLLSFDDSAKTIQVRLDFPEYVPNPKYRPNAGAQHNLMNDYNRLQQDMNRIQTTKNPRQAQQLYNQMMQLQAKIQVDMTRAQNINPNNMPFMVLHHLKDFDLDMQDNVVYRKMFLPQEYDDTGNLKTYSKDDLAKLRGDNKPKGSYVATSGEFHPGQGVWVYLSPPKKDGSSSSSSSSAAKEKDKEDAKTTTSDSAPRPLVKMLVINQEGSLPVNSQNQPKKKKNK